MIKKRFLLLISAFLVCCCTVCGAADIDLKTKNAVICGTVQNAGTNSNVTILLKDKDSGETAYIAEAQIQDGTYFKKFKFPAEDVGQYILTVREGDNDVTSGVLNASVHSFRMDCRMDISTENANRYFNENDKLRLSAAIKNIYEDESVYKLYAASYDADGKLIGVTKSGDMAVDYGKEGTAQLGELTDVEVPSGTAYVKLMAWSEDITPISLPMRQETGNNLYRSGDTVSFCGDSITHIGIYPYFIEHYYQTRYPDRNIDFYNKGVSGQTAQGVYNRLDWDIFSEGTNRITLMVGVNDISGSFGESMSEEDGNKAIDTCISNYRKVIEKCISSNVEITLVTPPLCDPNPKLGDTGNSPYVNEGLKTLSSKMKELASEYGISVYDINTLSNTVTEYGNREGHSSVIMGNDRIHPTDTGYTILGYCYLKEQGVEGTVASLSINGNEVSTDNCSVGDISYTENKMSFTYSPKASPMAVTDNYKAAEVFVPDMTDELNREIISVQMPEPGSYTLMLNGVSAGSFTSDELAAGINIAKLDQNPNQQRAKSAYEKLMLKDKETDKLRSVVLTRTFAGKYNIDTDAGYSAFLETYASHPYIGSFKRYKEYAADEQNIKAAAAEYSKQAAELSSPVSYTISLTAN